MCEGGHRGDVNRLQRAIPMYKPWAAPAGAAFLLRPATVAGIFAALALA